MRGTFFIDQIEYTLDVSGESWKQGDVVTGSLSLKNHSSDLKKLSDTGVFLVNAAIKKLKAKDSKAISTVQSHKVDIQELAAGSGYESPFTFNLSEDCAISETASSPYLICGQEADLINGGLLQLDVKPATVIFDYLEIFKNFYKFTVKTLKTKKDFIEATLVVPSSKEFTSLDQLKVLIKYTENRLDLKYQFKVKKIDYLDPHAKAVSTVVKFEDVIEGKELFSFGDSINHDGVSNHIDEALNQVRLKSFN